ncbi:MAG TPA: hypothetical protein VFB38_21030 [Chthonomonadaceae bacterium]|nr:hypothetical protein [Chthonomonadaceae bacterium]
MSEFERTKQEVSGRSILITSWYDDHAQSWRASAPAYAYLSSLRTTLPVVSPSRKVAVQRLSDLLATHFNRDQK